jgi:hypothetical protein
MIHLCDVIPVRRLAKGAEIEEPCAAFPAPVGYHDGQLAWLAGQPRPAVNLASVADTANSFHARRGWNIEQADAIDVVQAFANRARPPGARRR